ncbi:hypothetical protein BJX62DRAFT_234835 [Aspergillus germanicus]
MSVSGSDAVVMDWQTGSSQYSLFSHSRLRFIMDASNSDLFRLLVDQIINPAPQTNAQSFSEDGDLRGRQIDGQALIGSGDAPRSRLNHHHLSENRDFRGCQIDSQALIASENALDRPSFGEGGDLRGRQIDGQALSGSGDAPGCPSRAQHFSGIANVRGSQIGSQSLIGSGPTTACLPRGHVSNSTNTEDWKFISANHALFSDDAMDTSEAWAFVCDNDALFASDGAETCSDSPLPPTDNEYSDLYTADPSEETDSRFEPTTLEDDTDGEEEELNNTANPFEDAERNPLLRAEVQDLGPDDSINTHLYSGLDHKTDEERYVAAGIPLESVSEYRESFDGLLGRIIAYVSEHVHNSEFSDHMKSSCWVNGPTWRYFRKAKHQSVTEALLKVIPSSTRVILGNFSVMESLLALPHITAKPGQMGVYVCFVTDANGNLCAIYVGSSIADLMKRIRDHNRFIQRAKEKHTTSTFFQYAAVEGRTCHFRQITAIPACKSNASLMRVLEAVVMLILDALAPEQCCSRFTVNTTTLHWMQIMCGIKRNKLRSLNRALPLKQGGTYASTRDCSNCHVTNEIAGRRISWYFDTQDSLALRYLCPRCYRHEKRTGKPRPVKPDELIRLAALRGRTMEGPCSNRACGST